MRKEMNSVSIGRARSAGKLTLAGLIATVFLLSVIAPASAGDFSKPEELVVKADITFNHFVADPNMTWFRDHVKNAKAVFIVPQLLKAGFIFGGSGGSGALLARDPRPGSGAIRPFTQWGRPPLAFRLERRHLKSS